MKACYQSSKGASIISPDEDFAYTYLHAHPEDYLLKYRKYDELVYFHIFYVGTRGIQLLLSPVPDPTEEELAICKRIATDDKDNQ